MTFRQKTAIKVKDRDSGDCFDFSAVIITLQIYYSTIYLNCQQGGKFWKLAQNQAYGIVQVALLLSFGLYFAFELCDYLLFKP